MNKASTGALITSILLPPIAVVVEMIVSGRPLGEVGELFSRLDLIMFLSLAWLVVSGILFFLIRYIVPIGAMFLVDFIRGKFTDREFTRIDAFLFLFSKIGRAHV